MATVSERVTARRVALGESPSEERQYIITDATDKDDATTALLAVVSSSLTVASVDSASTAIAIPRSSVQLEELEGDATTFFATVTWGTRRRGALNITTTASPLIAEVATEFSTGGGTRHITHAIAQTAFPGVGISPAPDMRKAINAIDGEIQGVDIEVAQFRWTESYQFDASRITQAYVDTLKRLTGKVNQLGWRFLNAREVRLVNVRGSKSGSSSWKIDFDFSYEPSITNGTLGNNDVTGVNKPGQDYLWVLPKKKADNFAWAHTIYAAYVDQVYEEADFYDLGIGT